MSRTVLKQASEVAVLLVDDDEDDHVLMRDLLEEIEHERFALDWVTTCSAALERIGRGPIDVVLTDYRLGAESGLECIREMQAHGSPAPIILLTGQGSREVDLEAMSAGAADYLPKNELTPTMLERSIRYARERHRLVRELEARSLRDELTGLYNRRGFFTLAEPRIALAKRREHEFVLLFIDLDGMKQINDRLGHEAGDRALQETAALLQCTFRSTDVIARLGGDEFVVLAVDAPPGESGGLVDRLQKNVARSNAAAEREFSLALSIGVQIHNPDEPQALDELLRQADAMMYRQKQQNRTARRRQGYP